MKNSLKKVLALVLAALLLFQTGAVSPNFIAEIFAEGDGMTQEQVNEIADELLTEADPLKEAEPSADEVEAAEPADDPVNEEKEEGEEPAEETGEETGEDAETSDEVTEGKEPETSEETAEDPEKDPEVANTEKDGLGELVLDGFKTEIDGQAKPESLEGLVSDDKLPEVKEDEPKTEAEAKDEVKPAEEKKDETKTEAEPKDEVKPAEEKEDEKKEEIKPAELKNAKIGGGVVSISGKLPEGASVRAIEKASAATLNGNGIKKGAASPMKGASTQNAPRSSSAEEQRTLATYDISILDADGNKWQPAEPVEVTLTNDNFVGVDKVDIYHEGELLYTGIKPVGNTVTFMAYSFSIYVIKEGDETVTYRHMYHFMVPNEEGNAYVPYLFLNKAGETTDIQIVKHGGALEKITDPDVPSKKLFAGWYVLNDAHTATTSEQVLFDSPITVSEDKDIYVGAKFTDAYFIYFYDNVENSTPTEGILAKKIVEVADDGSAVVNIGDVEAAPITSTQKFVGWKLGTTEYRISDGTSITVTAGQASDGIVKLYPIFLEGRWLRFVSGDLGASGVYVEGIFVENGTTSLGNLPLTTREGFTFLGWFDGTMDGDGKITYGDKVANADGSVINEAALLTALASNDVTLYAKWQGKPVSYRVLTWYENADNDEYTYQGSTTVNNATAGEMTNVTASAVSGFVAQTIEQQEIAGDGTTVVNVYYKRAIYEVKFYNYRGNSEYTELKITAKYGADVHDQWPGVKPGTTNYPTTWYVSAYGNSYTKFESGITTMPLNGANYYRYDTQGRYTLRAVRNVQKVNGSNSFDVYVESSFKNNSTGITTGEEDYTPIKGFTLNADSQDDATRINNRFGAGSATYNTSYQRSVRIGGSFGNSGQSNGNNTYTLNFYYLRNQYSIRFEENGGPAVADATGIYYEADISNKKPASYVSADEAKETDGTPTTKTVNGIVYEFQGWYESQELATMDDLPDSAHPYDFTGKKMDAGDLVLYARWSKGKYRVNVDPNGGEIIASNNATYFNVTADETISRYNITRNYAPSATGTYRYMVDVNARKQYYIPADQTLTEGQSYVDDVLYAPVLESEYSLIGWYEVIDGHMSSSPFDFGTHISHDTTIRAKWRRTGTFTLRYDIHMSIEGGIDVLGDTIGDETDFSDASVTTLTAVPKNIRATGTSNKYVFIGWKDADGNVYKVGETFVIDAEQANANRVITLTAVYEEADKSEETPSVTSITFHANEGANSRTQTIDKLHVNAAIDLSTEAPSWTREGYILVGWNDDQTAATSGVVKYDSTFTVGVDNEDPDDNTLYAVWRQIIEVEITGDTQSYTYDGTEKSSGPYTITYKIGGEVVTQLPENVTPSITFTFTEDSDEGATIDAENKQVKATDVGEYKATVTVAINCNNPAYVLAEGSESKSANVDLTITPATVTVTIVGHNDTNAYDGQSHTVTGYDVTSIKIGEEDTTLYTASDFTFTGTASATRTNVVENGDEDGRTEMGLAQSQFTNNNSNFNVTFTIAADGYQEITAIDVTVTIVGHNSSVPYDGTAHTVTGYDVTSIKIGDETTTLYTEDDFSFSGEAKATRTNIVEGSDTDGKTDMDLTASQFTNNNNNFNVTFTIAADGYQEITPLNVTVTINGVDESDPYDGTVHKAEGYAATSSSTLYDASDDANVSFTGNKIASRKDVGTTYMGLAPDQFSNLNTNFNVTFEIEEDGYQEITPIKAVVTIVGNNSTDPYDGASHTVTGYEVTSITVNGAATTLYTEADFTFSGEAKATRTNVVEGNDTDGQTDMGLTASQFTNTNTNFSEVTFNITDGYQKITPVDVVVKIDGNYGTFTYDSDPHTVTGYEVTSIKIGESATTLYTVNDFTFNGEAKATRTNVVEGTDTDGKTDMGLTASQFINTNTNFGTVTFDVTDGYVEILPVEITVEIVGNTDTRTYNGTDQSVTGYEVNIPTGVDLTVDDLKVGETAVSTDMVSRAASGKNVGTYPMGLGDLVFVNTNKNYDVTFAVTDGWLKIDPKKVTLTAKDASKPYDGTPLSQPLFTASALETGDTHIFTVAMTAASTITNYGTQPNVIGMVDGQALSSLTPNAEGYYEIGNYLVKTVDGELKITKREITVTITGNQATKVYNGQQQYVEGYTISYDPADGPHPAEDKMYRIKDAFQVKLNMDKTVRINGTNIGTYSEGLAAENFRNTDANYDVTFVVAKDVKLVIEPKKVTITAKDASKPYDGDPLTQPEFTVTPLEEGDTHVFTVDMTEDSTITEVGTQPNVIEYVDDVEVTSGVETAVGNYLVTVVSGTLEITKSTTELSVESADGEWPYDGSAHTKYEYTVTYGTETKTVTIAANETTGTATL
ncbi:MAG: InlB B-repeat-containing protein, partial [Firmicutes bacterium]|nr:InlB B-repeat-containing protein [Bacillota bacterium]